MRGNFWWGLTLRKAFPVLFHWKKRCEGGFPSSYPISLELSNIFSISTTRKSPRSLQKLDFLWLFVRECRQIPQTPTPPCRVFKAVVSVEAALCESFGEDPILDARGALGGVLVGIFGWIGWSHTSESSFFCRLFCRWLISLGSFWKISLSRFLQLLCGNLEVVQRQTKKVWRYWGKHGCKDTQMAMA